MFYNKVPLLLLTLQTKSKWEFHNSRIKEIDAAFEWRMSPSEFRTLSFEDRVEMMAYLDATRKIKAFEEERLREKAEQEAKKRGKGK